MSCGETTNIFLAQVGFSQNVQDPHQWGFGGFIYIRVAYIYSMITFLHTRVSFSTHDMGPS